VNCDASKILAIKSMMFLYHYIHRYTWTSPDGKTHIRYHILIDRRRLLRILDVQSFREAECDDHYLVVAIVRESLAVSK
jgi:hypothetical protein